MKGGDPVATKSAKIAHCIRVEPPRPVLGTTAPGVPSDVTCNEMLERARQRKRKAQEHLDTFVAEVRARKAEAERAMKAEQGSFKPKLPRPLAQELQEQGMQRVEEARLTAKKGEMLERARQRVRKAEEDLETFVAEETARKCEAERVLKAEQGSFEPKPPRSLALELQEKGMQRLEEARLNAKKGEMNKTALVMYKDARALLISARDSLQGSSSSSSLDVLSAQDSEAWQQIVACKTEIENLEELLDPDACVEMDDSQTVDLWCNTFGIQTTSLDHSRVPHLLLTPAAPHHSSVPLHVPGPTWAPRRLWADYLHYLAGLELASPQHGSSPPHAPGPTWAPPHLWTEYLLELEGVELA